MSEEKQPVAQETQSEAENQPQQENTNLSPTEKALMEEAENTELPSADDIEKEIAALDGNEKDDDEVDEHEGDEEVNDGKPKELEDELTEDSEDESTSERHDIPKKDYETMDKEAIVKEFKYLLKNHKIQAIKEHVDEIRAAFNDKFDEEQEEAKEKFLEDGGNIIDFRYYSPIKKEFSALYFEYRDKRNKYYQKLKQDLKANLNTRNELVEELKALKNEVGGEESFNAIFNKFKDIQDRWRNAGNIPRDRYNVVWDTYHHHVENFYDFLHLNREFRDRDFKENLDKKLKIVERAEELAQENDVGRAFRELQMLHKMWKEEIGPVAPEYRDDIWDKFSAATKKIHDNRQEYFKNIDAIQEQNLERKKAIIAEINAIAQQDYDTHKAWQAKMKEVNELRDTFFKAGKVPRKDNQPTWNAFKEATRQFNRKKNGFYKAKKQVQYDNLKQKRELVKIAEENKDNEDIQGTIDLMKRIQADWKKIGHVPRKESDKVWKLFKGACNHFFDRLHASKNKANAQQQENLEAKEELLKDIKDLELTGTREDDLKKLKKHISDWKEIGQVPYPKKDVEQRFNKVLDGHFKQLDVDKKQAELIKFDNRISNLADADNDEKIRKERYFISKKIDEVKAEIRQLETNMDFFRHVDDKNPMVVEAQKNIDRQKEALEVWKAKSKKLKALDS